MVANERQQALQALTDQLGFEFRDPDLLRQAFQHASYVNEQLQEELENNERLEFLGDTVLDLAVSHLLMTAYPGAREGELSRYRAMLVDENGLYRVALELGLGDLIQLGRGEEQTAGREKPSILADTVEALFGAIYLDGGFAPALEIVRRLLDSSVAEVHRHEQNYDYKSLLQEHTQKVHRTLPRYRLVKEYGPAHDKTFHVTLLLNGEALSTGVGKTKKEAEQAAAREAFLCLTAG